MNRLDTLAIKLNTRLGKWGEKCKHEIIALVYSLFKTSHEE